MSIDVCLVGRDEHVAVKIQFPNIRESIESDLGYVKVRALVSLGIFLWL